MKSIKQKTLLTLGLYRKNKKLFLVIIRNLNCLESLDFFIETRGFLIFSFFESKHIVLKLDSISYVEKK